MNFLEQIARNYTSDQEKLNLRRYCFVFPNRRGYLFFRKYLIQRLQNDRKSAAPVFMPAFSNISAVISQLCPYNIIDPDEALFVLYDEYRKLAGSVIRQEEFHKDDFWKDVSEEWSEGADRSKYGTQPSNYNPVPPIDYNNPQNAPSRELGYDPSMAYVRTTTGETDNGATMTFDKFRYWGQMLLSDFDEIDCEMADAHQILGNVRKLEELTATDYLTDIQKEIITLFWGEDASEYNTSSSGFGKGNSNGKGKGKDDNTEPERFWRHMLHAEDSDVVRKFRYLWELMEPLYFHFRRRLRNMGYFTRGMSYRYVAEMLKSNIDYPLPFERYIFVGFNVLTKAEIQIFKSLQESGRADFYWDFESESFYKDEEHNVINTENKATRFIVRNMRHFQSKYPLEPSFIEEDLSLNLKDELDGVQTSFVDDPNLETLDYEEVYDVEESRRNLNYEDLPPEEVLRERPKYSKPEGGVRTMIGVSSAVGQVKVAQEFLAKLLEQKQIDTKHNAIDTVIVVNDESLLIPLLHSIPEEFSKINISLMMPTRHLPVASLVSELIAMQQTIRNGRYFHEPVSNILAHPLTRAIDVEAVAEFSKEITQRRMFLIDSEYVKVKYPTLYPLFEPIDTNVAMPEFDYLIKVLKFVIKTVKESTHKPNGEKQLAIVGDLSSQTQFLKKIIEKVDHIRLLCLRYMVSMSRNTILNLLERYILSDSVPVKGEPLEGLQVLSMLETRTLDFKNVIVLSMNETCYPRSNYGKSFIPEALRKGYGLSSIDDQESMYAYYFYRLLSRAKNFALIYDARIGNEGSGEMSRYLYQIRNLATIKDVTDQKIEMKAESSETREIIIAKDPEKLKEFKKGGGKSLSASALKIYKKCPLRFYFEHIARWRQPDEMLEYMDSSVYGTIIHNTLQESYQLIAHAHPNKGKQIDISKEHLITEDDLRSLWEEKGRRKGDVWKILRRNINKVYNRLREEDLDRELTGEALILSKIMFEIITTLFKQEKPFEFIAAEYDRIVELPINEDITIRFKFIIDRLDRIGDQLRIIDYKTGKDEVKFSSVAALFDSSKFDAIFQLFIYCNALIKDTQTPEKPSYQVLPDDYPIQPMIYKVTKTEVDSNAKEGLAPLKYGKDDLENQLQGGLNEEFLREFKKMIEGLFDLSIPFIQTTKEENCTYCPFVRLCNRNPQQWN